MRPLAPKPACARREMRIIALIAFFTLTGQRASGVTFSPENLLTSYQNKVSEYRFDGTLVQTITVPYPGTLNPSNRVRDLVIMDDGRLAVFNGTFSPYLSVFTPATATWQHGTLSGWSMSNSWGDWGGIGTTGPYVFVSDARTFGSPEEQASGAIRFDTRDFSAVRFDTTSGFVGLTIGLDGKLYTIGGDSLGHWVVKVFDPFTLAHLKSIVLPLTGIGPRDIAVDRDSRMYIGALDGAIRVFDSAGNLLQQKQVCDHVGDMDLSPDGRLVFGSYNQGVFVTDQNLQTIAPVLPLSQRYLAFPFPVPEPSMAALVLAAGPLLVSKTARGLKRRR